MNEVPLRSPRQEMPEVLRRLAVVPRGSVLLNTKP